MKTKVLITLSLLMMAPLALLVGCGKGLAPVSAVGGSSVEITVPLKDVHGKSFSNANVKVLYYLTGASASAPTTGVAGTAVVGTGSTFTFTVPGAAGTYNYVAIQLNDANNNQTIAIGAATITAATAPVTLGPVNKSIYQVSLGAGQAFGFQSDAVTNVGLTPTATPSLDIYCNTTSTGYELDELGGGTANVAFLGNGTFLNYLKASATSFSATSTAAKTGQSTTDVAPGDVFLVKLSTGYAWLQVTSVGSNVSFQYRVNTTLPYCGYEQTTADAAAIVAAANPTATPTVLAQVNISAAVTTVGSLPYDMAVVGPANSAATTIFIPNSATGFVYAYSASNLSTPLYQASVSSPIGLTVDPSGSNLYVASAGASVVDQFAIGASSFTFNGTVGAGTIVSGTDTTTQAGAGALASPRYMAFDNLGDLIITDSGTIGIADVMKYLVPSSGWLSSTTNVAYWTGSLSASTSSTCVGQIASAGTTILVADSANNRIGYYLGDGTSLGNLTSDDNPAGSINFNNPQGVAYSSSTGYVYISDTGNNRVVEVTLGGAFVRSLSTFGMNGPTGLKLDNAQPPNLYVADTGNGRILKLQ